jgi:phytoene dehydrogenase-like protein
VKAIVVGAGLAGLVAARSLHRAGWEVVVLEAGDGIGGRVRTDVIDGFRLDRGFQALFTGYPAVQRQLDLKALGLRSFDPGVIVVEDGRWHELGDPFRDLKSLASSALSSAALSHDKLLALRLRHYLRRTQAADLPGGEIDGAQFLRGYGFSEQFIDVCLRGVLGGLFLDRSLSFSSQRLLYDLKALALGKAALPRDGMQAVPDQIAAGLPDVRLNTPALRLERGGPLAIQTSTATIEADVVVLAAHSPEVERLSGFPMPKEANSVTCLYFHLPYPLYGNKKVVVNGFPNAFVSHAVQVSNVASSYAPAPEHLLVATVLGAPDETVEQLTAKALADMQRWFPWRGIDGLTPLAVYQVPFARLVEPPGFQQQRPENQTAVPGLYLAGEYTATSSIDGALASGEMAAEAILRRYPG